ncbi:hypothetical protein HN51_008795 [Arachis hypogaea]|uniref:Uncharacterized protein n=1 Tax=Arachis hypogaea TaxID=3818 RepID=A0A445D200_ARAHY|nr:hypothetical protein Ahy_A05g022957 [Arachis hypogaea]
MVRNPWREVNNLEYATTQIGFFGNAYSILWVILFAFCIISAMIFSCADGVSKDRTAAASDPEPYGAGCGAECGAGCGA